MVDSVFKNYKPFFINIGNDRDISPRICELFIHFWPVKFVHVTGSPKNRFAQSNHKYPHCLLISALHVKWFLSYRRINKFLSQKSSSSYVFFRVNSRSRYLESQKLTHMTPLIILTLSPNFNFLSFIVC